MNTSEKILKESAEGLRAIESGQCSLDDFLDSIPADSGIRRTLSSILFTYYRNKAFIDALIAEYVKKKTDGFLLNIIRVALTQIFFQSGIAPESAVNIAVSVAKNQKDSYAGNFVNAVLRNCRRASLDEIRAGQTAASKLNMPEFLYELWLKEYGAEKLRDFAALTAKESAFSLRVVKDLAPEQMNSCGIEFLPGEAWANPFRFAKCGKAEELFRSGLIENASIYIQDMSTAAALSLLSGLKAEKIADICAAPGGKTLMLSELFPEADIIAFDRSEKRLKLAAENFERFGKKIKTVVADASGIRSKGAFDLVLADVPCTNTGVIRKRPDSVWRLSPKSLEETVVLQKKILEASSALLKENGVILYSTCSIEDAENGLLVRSFAAEHGFTVEKEILLLPSESHEGSYGALLRKSNA